MMPVMILRTSSFSPLWPGAFDDQGLSASGTVLRFPFWQATAMHPWQPWTSTSRPSFDDLLASLIIVTCSILSPNSLRISVGSTRMSVSSLTNFAPASRIALSMSSPTVASATFRLRRFSTVWHFPESSLIARMTDESCVSPGAWIP